MDIREQNRNPAAAHFARFRGKPAAWIVEPIGAAAGWWPRNGRRL
jgi:hypothetical protein